MAKSYRIKANPNSDKHIQLSLEQDFDQLEILSLKIVKSDVYARMCADYGVVVGRAIANGGFGIPNAKISIFVPITEEDELDPVISELYPYKTVTDKNEDGYTMSLSEFNNIKPFDQAKLSLLSAIKDHYFPE